jgi:LysR family glycine cleavage system transcriptional activator
MASTNIPSLTALRCLDASARHGSFTRAAAEVHLTQGAVSHQILGLEQQFGVALFVRKRSGLELTPAGRLYWGEVGTALRQLERATQNLHTHKGQGGPLNLCVASSFATYWLMPRLGAFVAAHPEVTLNLSTHIGPVNFAQSPHDAAIEYCAGPTPELHAHRVLELAVRPYAAPSLLRAQGLSPRKPPTEAQLLELLCKQPLIRHTTAPEGWPRWLAETGLAGRVPARHLDACPQYDLLSMALTGVIAGIGIALLPEYLVAGAVASGQVVRLAKKPFVSDKAYWLRYPAWKAELHVLQAFRAWLEGAARL